MNKQLELQLSFQKLAGQKDFTLNRIPTIEERKLRLKLALEELQELAVAYGLLKTFNDLISNTFDSSIYVDNEIYDEKEALDACIDIAVINNGTIITQGHQEIFDREYENIDTNNKTKFHKTFEEAILTVEHYNSKNIKTYIEQIFDFIKTDYYVVKNESGKVIKPWNYESVFLNLNQ